MAQAVLDVRQLQTHFFTDRGVVRAVDGVSFRLAPGETLGVVGESGCGKSVTALSIMRLVRHPGRIVGGQVYLQGEELLSKSEREMQRWRGGRMAMIFQDPLTSLNPALKVGRQMVETIRLHAPHINGLGRAVTWREAWRRAAEMLERVGIPSPEERLRGYPHQMSGGMRQRVMIAIALSTNPALLIADEPTTALDVTIQAQILDLMASIKAEYGTSILFITHDFGVVSQFTDRVMVMYAGKAVESAPLADLLAEPRHPYTQGLLQSIPRLGDRSHRVQPIEGMVPDLHDLPPGCPYWSRCPLADEHCQHVAPALVQWAPDHWVACHKVDETGQSPKQAGDDDPGQHVRTGGPPQGAGPGGEVAG